MAAIPGNKTICLITTGHLASDPRLVKEAMALSQSGFKVHLVFTQYVNYLVEYDAMILNTHPDWTHQSLNWTGNSVSSKITRLLLKLTSLLVSGNKTRINRAFSWQLKKGIACRADMYIAHNLGALPVAVLAAKKNKTKCGFDAEDFHRNEVSDDIKDPDVQLKIAIEEKYIPQLDYITASSPQIAAEYASLFNCKVTTILNVFPKTQPYDIINNTNDPLKLFWFSQTIGPNRGLELIIKAINKSGLNIELNLLGKPDDDYKQYLIDLSNQAQKPVCNLIFHVPVQPDDIFKLAQKFDIGLAAEPGKPFNRNICLTNKLFTYIQCGLAVIASGTVAQTAFIHQHPTTGRIYNDADELAKTLIEYNNNRELLYQTKKNCFAIGQTTLNWENESPKFIYLVQSKLNPA